MAKTTTPLRASPKTTVHKHSTTKPAGKSVPRAQTPSNAINLRIDAETRALIDRAAAVTGQTRTDFMLTGARAQAELVLLDKVYFALDDQDWANLNSSLEKPAPANADLKTAFKSTPAWNRE